MSSDRISLADDSCSGETACGRRPVALTTLPQRQPAQAPSATDRRDDRSGWRHCCSTSAPAQNITQVVVYAPIQPRLALVAELKLQAA
jgi:hypothetical protein